MTDIKVLKAVNKGCLQEASLHWSSCSRSIGQSRDVSCCSLDPTSSHQNSRTICSRSTFSKIGICQCLPPPSTEKEKLAPAVKIAVWTVLCSCIRLLHLKQLTYDAMSLALKFCETLLERLDLSLLQLPLRFCYLLLLSKLVLVKSLQLLL